MMKLSKELSNYYCISGTKPENESEFIKNCIDKIESGYKLIQLRSKHFSLQTYQKIVCSIIEIANKNKTIIMLNSDMIETNLYGAYGVHLTEKGLNTYFPGKYGNNVVLSASCHSLNDIQLAEKFHCDFITLSPVLETNSHPEANLLGWEVFSQMTNKTKLKVFALGGISKDDLTKAKEYGAYGVAGISGFW